MKKDSIHLSVVIPAYNESARIGETLSHVRSFLDAQPYASEVIVVDDGSTDMLQEVLEQYMHAMPYLKVIRYMENRGKGYAVRKGMRNAQGEYRLFMDADNSVTIDHVTKFISEAQCGHDVVIGSIMLPHSGVAREQNGMHRRILRIVSKAIRSLLTNLSVHDTQRGFKLFSKEAAERIFALQRIERFGFDIELLVLAQIMRFSIKELGVIWDNPIGSKVTLMSYPQSLLELLTIRWNIFTRRYNF